VLPAQLTTRCHGGSNEHDIKEVLIMAVATRTGGQLARPRRGAGRPPTPRRQSRWDRLLAAIDWLNRTTQLVAEVERVGPYRSAEAARRWVERQ
jgi:hypothetical protein